MERLVKVRFKQRGICPRCGSRLLATITETVTRISFRGKKLFDIVITSQIDEPECCHCSRWEEE